MVKKLFSLILIILLLFVTLTFNEFYNHNQYIATFKSYVVNNLKISNELVENYYGKNDALRKEASQSIILTTLKNLKYEQWIEYADYIDMRMYKSNVLPSNNDELIVVLNLSKDQSVIAIYTPLNDEYIFSKKIENLLPIQNIEFLPAPELGYNLLVTDQLLDEQLGAFLLEEFLEIFLYEDDHFKSIWKKTKYSNEIYNAQWVNQNAPSNEWIQIIEENDIQFNKTPNLNISVLMHRQKLNAIKETFPSEEDFHPVEKILTKENYYWSPKYQTFIMGEGSIKNTSASIAIIDDTSHWLESFLGFPSNNYRILTEEGKVFYIHRQLVTINH